MRRFNSLGLSLLLVFAIALAACGSNAPASSNGPVTVQWWSWNPSAQNAQTMADAFNASHPNIKLVYKFQQFTDYSNSLKLAIASGTGPDVFGLQAGGFLQQYSQFLEDLGPYEQKSAGANWQNQYYAFGLQQLQVKNTQLALPFFLSAAGYIWYNKNIFDQYGLQPPQTFDQWVTVCQQLQAKGVTPFIQGAKDTWQDEDMYIAIANSIAPGKIYDAEAGKISWTDPDLLHAMDVWKSLFSDGVMQKGALGATGYPDAHDQWVAGKAAMVLFGTWNNDAMTKTGLGGYQTQLGFTQSYQYLPFLFPQIGSQPSRLFGGPDVGLGINKNSKVKAAAWTALQWLESATGGQQINAKILNIPAIKGVNLDDSDVYTDAQKATLKQELSDLNNTVGPRAIPYAALDTALGDALQNVASSQLTSQQALQAVQQASQGIQR